MQQRAWRWLIVAGVLAVFLARLGHAQDKNKNDLTSPVVDLDGLKSETPKTWKREKPANLLRSYQFRLPRANGDADDAELGILPDVTGKDDDNLARYKKMFLPPEGKKLDDVSVVEKFQLGAAKVTFLDVQGTYLKKNRPLDPDFKATKMPNYRMFALLFETKENTHLLRVVGPAQTMAQHRKAFVDWVKNFK